MTDLHKIAVITPTWQRHDLLIERCIPSIDAQRGDFRSEGGPALFVVWHIIVSDGPDPGLREKLGDRRTFVELPEHRGKCGTYAINAGVEAAKRMGADLFTVVDDDNAARPRHCEVLYRAIVAPWAEGREAYDFAYSQIYRHGIGDTIGSDPPRLGGIDGNALMWWARTHQRFGMWPHVDRWPDWRLVSRWLRQGASYVHVPEVTVDYYYHPGALSWRG